MNALGVGKLTQTLRTNLWSHLHNFLKNNLNISPKCLKELTDAARRSAKNAVVSLGHLQETERNKRSMQLCPYATETVEDEFQGT